MVTPFSGRLYHSLQPLNKSLNPQIPKLKMLRIFASLLLLPLCVAVPLATLSVLRAASSSENLFSPPTCAFAAGWLAWMLVWFLLKTPMKIYVFGHEMTHALWGLLFGARVGKMRVSNKGGSVMLSKTNLLISLAPYFFPFYTMLVVGVYLLAACFMDMARFRLAFLFLVAFTWGFHITFTFISLRVRQPDVMEHGRLFSWVVIWLANIAQVGLWMVAVTPVMFSFYWTQLCARSGGAYFSVWLATCAAAAWTRRLL